MAQTEEAINQTENFLKQLAEGELDELGYDLKNLTSVLRSLQLFRQKDDIKKEPNKKEGEQEQEQEQEQDTSSEKSKNSSKKEPRLIGAVKKNKKNNKKQQKKIVVVNKNLDSSSGNEGNAVEEKTKDIDTKSDGSRASSVKSSKRGSRGSRRSRRRRLAKKRIQAKLAADLLSRISTDTKQLTDSSDATSEVASSTTSSKISKKNKNKKTMAPPPEFYKYPSITPKRDFLRDPVTGENRPVWCVTVPLVCDQTNTPFYAQCSTSKQGYCTRCGVLRKGHQKTGSVCTEQGCNERLTAKYHRWFPGLIRLEPYGKGVKKENGKERDPKDYEANKDLFKLFNITWNSEEELKFVVEHYLLLKVFVVSPDFDVAPLHLERSYMIGVFAGRAFQTGALARKFLRDGLKLMSFRTDYPSVMRYMANYRANIVEELNQIFFQGRFRCYFHAHQTNVEGWYDPTQVDPSTIKAYFKEICDRHINVSGLTEKAKKRVKKTSTKNKKIDRFNDNSSSTSSTPRVSYPKNPGRFDFAKKKLDNKDKDGNKDKDKDNSSTSSSSPKQQVQLVPASPPGFDKKLSSTSTSSSSSKSSKKSGKKKSKSSKIEPQISYVPVYFTPQPMMAPNGQMMMAAPPQPYGDPRTTVSQNTATYPQYGYAMPPQQVQPNSYYQQPYYGNTENYGNYGYAAYPSYSSYGYGYQNYATINDENCTTQQVMPAGYGQPVDIPPETKPGSQALHKPIYPTHFVPVDANSAE